MISLGLQIPGEHLAPAIDQVVPCPDEYEQVTYNCRYQSGIFETVDGSLFNVAGLLLLKHVMF